MEYSFTSESVGEGHPDKVSDKISDTILDHCLEQDENSRVACETFVSTGLVLIGGEITTQGYVDTQKVVRDVLLDLGYTHPQFGIDGQSCSVLNAIHSQSADIDMGVSKDGAGDQGLMFGFACDETPELMPAPIQYAHDIMKQASKVRRSAKSEMIGPDGKCQVTIDYENDQPKRISKLVLSHQHKAEYSSKDVYNEFFEKIIKRSSAWEMMDNDTEVLINPTGRFVIGGPHGDTGLTGRKIIVDTYGGYAPHGGGAFSGKDPTKVDRSATYMARYIAKNVVAAELAKKCQIQISYAIGIDRPLNVYINTFGTGRVSDEKIEEIVEKEFDLTPKGIISTLDLRQPIYSQTTNFGHFGRDGFTWEEIDKVKDLKKYV